MPGKLGMKQSYSQTVLGCSRPDPEMTLLEPAKQLCQLFQSANFLCARKFNSRTCMWVLQLPSLPQSGKI